MRRTQAVVFVFLGTSILILCTASTIDCVADTPLPKGLPSWFKELDTDQDGQISLHEWRQGGKKLADFRKFDLNDDGFITPEEVVPRGKKGIPLKLEKGQVSYAGAIDGAAAEKYQGRKLAKTFTVRLEAGKTYQIDHVSRAFDAYLYLEGPDGAVLAQDDDGGGNLNSRIVHRAAETGTYRLVATSLGGNGAGPFSLSVRVLDASGKSARKDLPAWFKTLDTDQDGQISLHEWRQGGKKLADFRKFDLNDDGFITAEEALGTANNGNRLRLENGRVNYQGNIDESAKETYRGKKSFKVVTVHLERGKTYQIEQVSQVYFAYLYLEDPDGKILDRNNSGGNGRTARIVHRAARTGTYRLIATSQGGFRTGPFSLSVRILDGPGGSASEGLPAWFKDLDTDQDGQISLHEWRQGGKKLKDFRKFDLNDDGFITAEEVFPRGKKGIELKLANGQASYTGAIAGAADGKYQGRKLAKTFTVRLEGGKTYQIDHVSRAFDAYLYLEGPDGAVLAQDDDGGGNLNSRIVHRAAETGTYRLIATSANGNGVGPFSLSVRVRDGSRVRDLQQLQDLLQNMQRQPISPPKGKGPKQ